MPDPIDCKELVPMDLFAASEPITVDLAYARANHPDNIFGVAAYHENARLCLHRDLARIVIHAARHMDEQFGWRLILKDGLRPVEAQEILIGTDIVRRNPHWLEPPRLLSSPGQGAHPRAMAIDLTAADDTGKTIDMGTAFDAMVPQSARSYVAASPEVRANRRNLETAMVEAARSLRLPLLPLPSEWWDYRFPADYVAGFEPLCEADLPPPLRMLSPAVDDAWDSHFDTLAKSILLSL